MNTKLWQPIQVGDIKLSHRLAMAPMTRSRATAQGVPTDLNAEYYAQRASTALIISGGTQPSEGGQGYLFTSGIYTDDQVIGKAELPAFRVTQVVRSFDFLLLAIHKSYIGLETTVAVPGRRQEWIIPVESRSNHHCYRVHDCFSFHIVLSGKKKQPGLFA
jgi:NADH:flavin oxidoreductase / NADH oxidase family